MSFAAEPYGVFVDGILTALTGGVARESFVFEAAAQPFRLNPPGPVRPAAVRVHGLVKNAFRQFRRTVDFTVDGTGTLSFLDTGAAVQPDEGTRFYVNYDHQGPSGAAPVLSDRNPGSVTRLLAESMAREYAVLSAQLEAVYRGAYVETATGRDLDALARLVGVTRRDATYATGSVVLSRATPAKGDIAIPAGTRLSTADAPGASFETMEPGRLRRGTLSVELGVQALAGGAAGVVPGGAVAVINRPILGIERVENPQATHFASGSESDEALRERVMRALEYAGRATTGALKGALTRVEGLREKDILIREDPILRPGVVQLDVALPEMSAEARDAAIVRALDLIEEARPVGVRIRPNIDAPAAAGAATPGGNAAPDEGPDPVAVGPVSEDLFMPVDVAAVVTPTTLGLTNREREDLRASAEAAVRAFIAEAGIGETLVYNRLVADLMALDGVLDVAVEMRAVSEAEGLPGRKNIIPAIPSARPSAGTIAVSLGGALLVVDVTATVTLKAAGLIGDASANRESARAEIEAELRAGVATFAGNEISPATLKGLTTNAESYDHQLSYLVNYEDDGVRINKRDVVVPLSGLERLWIGSVKLAEAETPS